MGCLKLTYQKNNLEVIKNYFKKELTSKNSSKNDYSYLLFGSTMPGRTYSPKKYRFGYQGSEKDFDVAEGNYTTHFRMLDTRLGRWKSVDPKWKKFPHQSPYVSMDNKPIVLNDVNGDCPQCLSGAIIGLLTQVVADVGWSYFVEGQDFGDAVANIDKSDAAVSFITGGISGAVDGGSSRLLTFIANPRNQKMAKLVLAKSLDVIIEVVENVGKDYFNGEDIDYKAAVIGAIVEAGGGNLLPKKYFKYFKDKVANFDLDIARLTKKIDNGVNVEKYTKKLNEVLSNKEAYKKPLEMIEVVKGAILENAGNEASDVYKDAKDEFYDESNTNEMYYQKSENKVKVK